MMDRGTVQNTQGFYFKNKFEKLVHLVGFIIRTDHDVWSTECQMPRMSEIKEYQNIYGVLVR